MTVKNYTIITVLLFNAAALKAGNSGITEFPDNRWTSSPNSVLSESLPEYHTYEINVFLEQPTEEARATKSGIPERLVLGGGLGLSFGNYTSVTIAPQVGYRINRYLTAGGGFSYNYYSHKKSDYEVNYFGLNLYARAYPVRYLTIYIQPEVQRSWSKNYHDGDGSKVFGCFLVGGGVVLPIGYRAGMIVSVYYDVIQDRLSPYGNKIGYSVGYTFNF